MLHRNFYESLPYLYLSLGAACALLVESTVIQIAALLLIAAGLLVLVMRYQFRYLHKQLRRALEQEKRFAGGQKMASAHEPERTLRAARERRQLLKKSGSLGKASAAAGDQRLAQRRQLPT